MNDNKLYGKTIIWDGDSICAGNPSKGNWATRIAERNSMTYKNYAVGGGTVAEGMPNLKSGSKRHCVSVTLEKMYAEYPDADYVILEGGTNDADLYVREGKDLDFYIGQVDPYDFSGEYDRTTFAGALESVFFRAAKYWCGKKIGFFAAPHPSLSTAMDKKAAFVFAEIDMDDFASIEQLPLAYNEPSRFPSIDIDLSFFADTQTIDFRALEEKFFELAGGILASVKVADIYVDADSNESVTFRFEFSSPERTLSKAELTPTTTALIEYLESVGLKFKAA